ncbi:hypothetical protein EBT31_08460 [bacterium]|nr:hypothetical protein [bacterium]NBX49432.1 hypothetical protein [bacterium]
MLPSWLEVVLLGIAPITEYQLAIPVALTKYEYPWYIAYSLGVIGSFLSFFPLYFGFEFVRNHVARLFPRLVKPFDLAIERAERKLRGDYEKYGAMALFLALVVPFPLTGVWTTTLAAVALKIPIRSAALGIFLGLLSGAALVTLASLGVIHSLLFTE